MIINMLSNPIISIIMPCFNAAHFIKESVQSALEQECVDIEVIVVDDGSTDDSSSILQRMSEKDNRLRIIHQENKGAGPARNRGLAEAKGQFIAFLDSDDYWDSSCLGKLYSTLISSNADISYCGWQNIGLSGGRGEPHVPPDYADQDMVEVTLKTCP